MATDPNPAPSAANPPAHEPGAEEKRSFSKWTTRLTIVACVLVVAAMFSGRLIWTAASNYWGRRLTEHIKKLVEEEKFDSAAVTVGKALRFAPDEPEVIRTSADFLRKTGGDPEMVRFFLEKLGSSRSATVDDTINLGDTLITIGDVPRARRLYNGLPTVDKQKRKGMELLAKILDDEGQKPLSMSTLRQALLSEPDNPECVLRLAMLDLDQPFNETRRHAQETIWKLARGADNTALMAMLFLANSKELTAGEAAELLKTVNAHPKSSDKSRFPVLSAYMRLFPTRRAEILEAECARYKGKDLDALLPLLHWLNAQREPERVLGLVSKSLVLKSADAFPPYADALIASGKYADLKALIAGNPPAPLSEANAHAYLAVCYGKLEPDLLHARQEIQNAYRAAAKHGEHTVTMRCAGFAESLGLWDLAAEGYEAVAAKNSRARVPMLTKVYEMAALTKNGSKMLDTAARIAAARPDSWLFRARADYLRLLLGSGFEEPSQSVLTTEARSSAVTRAPENASYLAVLRALAFFRIGDFARIKEELAAVTQPESLPPGVRAVLAGLMRAAKEDPAASYRIAETVPATILLPEEARFLQMAR